MPTSKIKKDAREGRGSVPGLEHKWDKAKKSVEHSNGGSDNWPETMSVYKKMTHQAATQDTGHAFGPPKSKARNKAKSFESRARYRLRASQDYMQEPNVDGAPVDVEEYAAQEFNMEGMNGTYGTPVTEGPVTKDDLQTWLKEAKIPFKHNPGSNYATVRGTVPQVTKALTARGWTLDPKTKHLKCDEYELYVSQPEGQPVIVTDLRDIKQGA
jgi:hypothetical protein